MPIVSDTTNAPERFSLLGEDEPTDEQLEGLLREMLVDVQTRARLARQKLMETLQRDTDEARARYGLPPLRVF
jgi:hypothetical protein